VLLQSAAAALLSVGASQTMALGVTLCAEPYTQSVPGNGALPMWGYRQVASAAGCESAGTTASPGPLITVPAGDSTLAITLVNKLNVPTSIVLAAQSLPVDGGPPVMAADVVGPTCVPTPAAASTAAAHPQNCRVRSFTGETDPGASRTYTFNNIRPGTYLYQSGTHPQVQVQMGLFGMAKQDATVVGATGRQLFAGANAGFDVDVPVVLSEIDPEQHILIAGTLGGADPTTWKSGKNSTLNYVPKFFLINGKMFDSANPNASDLVVANAGNGARVALRIANAGLQSRSLMLNSGTWKLLTEDGYPYRAAREQATALVPAGKTTDAMLISSAPSDGSVGRSLAIFDRRGGTDNADGSALGGQVARLAQSGPAVPFMAAIGNQVANEGSAFAYQVIGGNIDTYSLATATPGITINPTTGLINWAVPTGVVLPLPTVASLTVTGSGSAGAPVSQSFSVRINHTPTIAPASAVAVTNGTVTVAAPGLLSDAADVDADPVTAVQTAAASAGVLTLNADGSYSWTRSPPTGPAQTVTFGVAARDPYGLTSTSKTVTLNVAAVNTPPTAIGDAYTITLSRVFGVIRIITASQQVTALTRPISTLTGNDTDPDGNATINLASVTVVPGSVRKINLASPTGCTTNCDTIPTLSSTPLNWIQAEASVVVTGSTSFRFVPRVNILTQPETGTYEFRYTVRDAQGALSNEAVVRVTVN
jgi:VCBS repeat-containing protein